MITNTVWFIAGGTLAMHPPAREPSSGFYDTKDRVTDVNSVFRKKNLILFPVDGQEDVPIRDSAFPGHFLPCRPQKAFTSQVARGEVGLNLLSGPSQLRIPSGKICS